VQSELAAPYVAIYDKYIGKYLKFSVLIGTAIRSTATSSWDEIRTECMHFNPCTAYLAKVGIKMHGLSFCFISAACFQCFLLQFLSSINHAPQPILGCQLGFHNPSCPLCIGAATFYTAKLF